MKAIYCHTLPAILLGMIIFIGSTAESQVDCQNRTGIAIDSEERSENRVLHFLGLTEYPERKIDLQNVLRQKDSIISEQLHGPIFETCSDSYWEVSINNFEKFLEEKRVRNSNLEFNPTKAIISIDSSHGNLIQIELINTGFPDYEYTDFDNEVIFEVAEGAFTSHPNVMPQESFINCLMKLRDNPIIAKRIIAYYTLYQDGDMSVPAWVITLVGMPPYDSSSGATYTTYKAIYNAIDGTPIDVAMLGKPKED